LIGLEPGVVKVIPYQSAWRRLYLKEEQLLHSAVGASVLEIQHVGSTAIPGLPAKPIIDIGIAVQSFEEGAACIQPIERLGYVYRGENGIPRRHYFRKGSPRTHHIHINEIASADWQNLILFRDYLLNHPEAVREYAALKLALAERYPQDREAYLSAKAPFIEKIIALARPGSQ
jgi:GrpB-like predicted nucleotidyltransferase (UPF0157 family)